MTMDKGQRAEVSPACGKGSVAQEKRAFAKPSFRVHPNSECSNHAAGPH